MENNLSKEQIILKKCFKSYLSGKKYYNTDNDKSYKYFKQCMKIINDMKNKNIILDNNFTDIIDQTETECSKFISLSIEKTINKPFNKITYNTKDNSELFDIVRTGNINKLKIIDNDNINFNIYNEEGLTPLHYAIQYGDITFLKEAFKLGACIDQTNKLGHTLLEYACLEKDPNIIYFLADCGTDMNKHLEFRKCKKYFANGNQIDIFLLEKIIIDKELLNDNINHLNFFFNYIDKNEPINIGYCNLSNISQLKSNILFIDFVKKLDQYLETIEKEKAQTYIDIIKEELSYDLSFKLGCPIDKINIILYNLVPFIEYNYNLKLNWLISIEIKYIILKILKNKKKINIQEFKNELSELLYNSYIKYNIISKGLVQILLLQWISKIKL